ncbi:MAG TPA: hypothetical protein VHT91_01955 [Kofleriaceae bacterium]|nr:hypothetical protein [Kofleriaceae bacterium]
MRPTIAPAAAAALIAGVPARLIKKLDADPGLAERWTWTEQGGGWTVQTDRGETVTAPAVIHAPGDLRCSCLLQPRCLHIAAVVAVLEPAVPDPAAAGEADAPLPPGAAADARAVRAPSVAAPPSTEAHRAFTVCAELLATGAEAAGAFVQTELLRAIHACRGAGLHRLAAAQTRVLRSIRDLRADRPGFSLRVLTGDLRDALAVAWALAAGDATPGLVGTARRDYEPAGNLHLRGLFTEAVVARTGYAGAVTYLIDDRGAIYTRADIAPGDAARAAAAYDAASGLGDAVLPHRELSRAGLFLSDATASADGRLGAGQRVRAVRASEPSRWDHPLIAARWAVPLADQLAAVAAHDGAPDELRPAGWDLVFVEGTIAGGPQPALVVSGRALRLTTALVDRALPARDNLAALAAAHGLRVRAIGRVRLASAGRLELLALGPAPGETRLALPEVWHGRANLHHDRLPAVAGAAAKPAAAPVIAPPAADAGDDDLLEPLRRRVERVVLGGLGTLPVHALAELERDAAALADRSLGGGADALRDLAALAHAAGRTMTGTRRAVDRASFGQVWLRAALYDDAARRRLHVARW